jgi:hypothetical protein
VDTLVQLEREGGEWVARSANGQGDIELRFHETGSTILGVTVTGSIRGHALATPFDGAPATDVQVQFDPAGTSQLEGTKPAGAPSFILGRISGSVTFTDSSGAGGVCAAVSWTIQPTAVT